MLNYISKVVEKVVANEFFQYCKYYSKLYLELMGRQKKRFAIHIIAIFIHTVQEKLFKKKLTATLFINVTKVFHHILKDKLFLQMIMLRIMINRVIWIVFFLTKQKIWLVIDSHDNKKRDIQTEISLYF